MKLILIFVPIVKMGTRIPCGPHGSKTQEWALAMWTLADPVRDLAPYMWAPNLL